MDNAKPEEALAKARSKADFEKIIADAQEGIRNLEKPKTVWKVGDIFDCCIGRRVIISTASGYTIVEASGNQSGILDRLDSLNDSRVYAGARKVGTLNLG